MTLNFDLLNPKLKAFILVPKSNEAESLMKYFSRHCVNNVQDSRTNVGTRQIHNASDHYVGGGIKITT